jgi:hypothetical protein
MHRSHLLRWFALVVAVCSFQCLDDLSDDCQKTRTCEPAPQLGSDCIWRYPDGRIWEGAPHQTPEGVWVWPNGKRTETQRLDCAGADAGVFDDSGLGTIDYCPTIPCDAPLLCDLASSRCVKCLDDEACKGTSDTSRGQTPVCDARIHDCVVCREDANCETGHCKIDANPANNRCVQCTKTTDCSGDDVCDLGSNQCTSTCSEAAQCKAPKPVCNSPPGLCVGCLGNADCSGATAKCNTSRKECVQCVDDSSCTAATAPVCSPGNRCVECVDDSTCRQEGRGHCDPVTNTCTECLTSNQCASRGASKCNALHQCVACTDNSQCESDAPICDVAGGGRCVVCLNDGNCTPNVSVCDIPSGNCVGCADNADCNRDATAARCDVPNHVCVACQNSSQCVGKFGPRDLCLNDECVQCATSQECTADPNKSRCDSNGLCAGCRVSTDCNLIAGKHACTGGNNGRCVECTANTDCVGNARGPACNTTTNTCVPCVVDTDCKTAAASRCVANQCVGCVNDPASGNTPANSHCGHIVSGGTPLAVCDTSAGAGVCVQCTGDQRAACGANVCNGSTRVCTTFPVGSAATCLDCVSDAHCAATDRCVPETFGGINFGFSCFPLKPAGNCPGRPYSTVTSLISIDHKAVDVCLPRLTTCAGVNQSQSGKPCTVASECGEDAVDDGACDTTVGNGFCSVPCATASDCLSPLSVCSIDGVCR